MRRYAGPIILVVVAAVAGYVLARAGGSQPRSAGSAPLSRTLSTHAFAVRYPSDWHATQRTAVPGVLGSGAVAVGPVAGSGVGERLELGTSAASTVSALPSAFLHSLGADPRPEAVILGRRRFDRYLDLRPRGSAGVTSLYLLATDRSTIAAACVAPRASTRFTAQCEQVLATLRLPAGVKPLSGVDAAYALSLNQALARLDSVRADAGPGLRSRSTATRARAADALAGAESAAAHAIGKLAAGSAASVNRRITAALRDAGQAYRALASAARSGNTDAYDAAAKRLTVDQHALTTAFRRLAALGYRLR